MADEVWVVFNELIDGSPIDSIWSTIEQAHNRKLILQEEYTANGSFYSACGFGKIQPRIYYLSFDLDPTGLSYLKPEIGLNIRELEIRKKVIQADKEHNKGVYPYTKSE